MSYRLVLMLALTLLGLALLLTVEWPYYHLYLMVFQSPLAINVSLVWPMVGLLTTAMALGVTLIFRQHLAIKEEPVYELLVLWPLPTLIVGLAAWLLYSAASSVLWVGGIIVTGLALSGLFHLEYTCLSDRLRPSNRQMVSQLAEGSSWAEWGLQVLAYLVALAYFVLIYGAKLRTLLSAPAMLVVGGLLSIRLLHSPASDWREEGLCALAVGLTLGEATWALNHWPSRGVAGGILLLLVFYVLIGLGRRGLNGQLTKSAIWEYGVVGLVGLGLLLRFGS